MRCALTLNKDNLKLRIIVAMILILASKLLLYAGLLKGYSAYVVQPFLWFLAFAVLFDLIDRNSSSIYTSILLASINIGVLMLTGIISGWGLNSYDTSIYGVLLNIIRIIPYVLGLEFLRAAIVQRIRDYKNLDRNILLISVFFTMIMISLSKFMLSISDEMIMLKFIISTLLPLFSLNLFLTYLLLNAGVWNTVSFSLISKIFVFIAPVLPNIQWFIEGIVYTSLYLGLLMLSIALLGEIGIPKVELKRTSITRKIAGILTYIVVVMILVIIMVGSFKPFVIASGSMEPNINIGDIVLMKSTSIDSVHIGDVIAYTISNRIVVHRVVEILNESNKIYIKTKGDANKEADPELVTDKMFLGEIIYVIPKVGLIILGFQYIMVNHPYIIPSFIVGVFLLYVFLSLMRGRIGKHFIWGLNT